MSTQPFLVEIGTEELPPKALYALQQAFADHLQAQLREARLDFSSCRAFGAPRRLAVLVEDLTLQQPSRDIEKLGPAVAAAFDDAGKPSKAAEGFARSHGVSVDQLQRVPTDKGERLAFRAVEPGGSARELLPTLVGAALDQLPIPKRMRWGAHRAEFIRPVHWLVMLLGDEVVPATLLGLESGRHSRGHRFHAPEPFALSHAADYQLVLENERHVIADFHERRGRIREQVEAKGRELGGQALIDPGLLDEVTGLVEWPVTLAGAFEPRFLDVPSEALISSMQEHQKYFPVVDAEGRLLPHFIFVANIDSLDPAQVIEGNQRVIRPRLSDAAFFYDTDRKLPLAQRRERLKSVIFQDQLGSLWDKSERVRQLAADIAARIGSDVAWAERAGELAKCDLVTEMVFEFDDMQGLAGYYYARHDGEPEEVAQALKEQYLPRFAGDELPRSLTGCALALADRLDTLVGIFGIGQPPTGSKDPFALRRAALGVLRLCVEKGLDLDLRELLVKSVATYADVTLAQRDTVDRQVLAYLLERFRAWYEDEGIAVEVFLAVSAKNLSRPVDIDQRVHAVHRFSQLPEAQALAAANKRVSNLLAKSDVEVDADALDTARLVDAAERELADALARQAAAVEPLFQQRRYREGLELLAALRAPVDRFFDEVMVMSDDLELRSNRLALLKRLQGLFLEVADISLLAQ